MQQTEEEIHYRGVDLDYITTFPGLLQQYGKLLGSQKTVEMHLITIMFFKTK